MEIHGIFWENPIVSSPNYCILESEVNYMLEHKWILYLEQQKKQEYSFKDVDKAELVEVLLANIGDHNAHIRDELIYPNLAQAPAMTEG